MTERSRLCMHPADWDGTVPAVYFVEAKIDGVRAICLHDASPRLMTKSGVHIAGARELTDALAPVVLQLGEPWMFDGELMAGMSFEETNANVRAGRLKAAVYHIFDGMPMRDWRRGGTELCYDLRRKLIEQAWANATAKSSNATIMNEGRWVHLLNRGGPFTDPDPADKMFEFAREKGAEGIVIKDASAGYRCGKSTGWIRRKVRETVDLAVLSVCEGEAGKPGIVVDHCGVAVRVYAGVRGDDAPAAVAEIAHLGVTSGGSLRSPSFVRWRPDKERIAS